MHERGDAAQRGPGGARGGERLSDLDDTEAPGIALVRRAFEAFARRDLSTLVELTDPEIELFAPTAALANESRCYRGHDGVARYLQDVERVWARLEVSPEEFREAGNHVVAIGSVHAEARDGLEIENPAAWVWELRGGRLCWGCVYDDPDQAFMGLTRVPETAMRPVGELVDELPPPARTA